MRGCCGANTSPHRAARPDLIAKLASSRVLATGADGFIGSHLVEELVAAGAQVRALCLYNSFNKWGWLEQVGCLKEMEVIAGDIRDAHLCEQLTRDTAVVFHLAALIPIPYSYLARTVLWIQTTKSAGFLINELNARLMDSRRQ